MNTTDTGLANLGDAITFEAIRELGRLRNEEVEALRRITYELPRLGHAGLGWLRDVISQVYLPDAREERGRG